MPAVDGSVLPVAKTMYWSPGETNEGVWEMVIEGKVPPEYLVAVKVGVHEGEETSNQKIGVVHVPDVIAYVSVERLADEQVIVAHAQ